MDVHFSKQTDEWATPIKTFLELDREFSFELDTCATPENAKCARFYTKDDSGLDKEWASRNWCNPPYSRVKYWVLKARREQLKGNLTVMLIPARTDTAFFHDSIYNKPDVEYRFVRGRLKFGDAKDSAPFPSMIVIFRPH
jgi:phage N-6-adenine-methyltransferase